MNDLLEKDLQRHVRAFAEGLGWRVYHSWTSIHSPRGFPDLLCIRDGEIVAIELKREKGKVSPLQDEWIGEFRKVLGVRFAGVIRPSNWFAGELDEVLR